MQGQTSTNITLAVPPCPSGNQFLVQGVYVGPEVMVGETMITVVDLPKWAVSVPVYQTYSNGGQQQVALVAIGNGPQAISASIPAGQSLAVGFPLVVTITLVGGSVGPPAKLATASQRFEFNLHLWGCCGQPFLAPP